MFNMVCERWMGWKIKRGGGARCYSHSGSGGTLGLTFYIKILGMSRQNIFNMFNTNSYFKLFPKIFTWSWFEYRDSKQC